ncbi:hypothetical protein [Chryseobacterium sp. AG363]|uniref:hypothetical protein n=1 Tax=Chryseobacterium sp. AG363 TaxID=2183997 RepID=UPI000E762C14|nr:hypothetical protein [Chryseobacterium sp. AG363]RKE82018.1 hypothetical protein DEU39_1568 [Chryseobacterium sp. AG363]
MWYNLKAQNLVLQCLPTFLRRGSISSLLALAASELTDLNNALVANRNVSISKVSHNSQVCKLRKILNDTFDYERRIKVVEGVLKKPKYIYTDAEQKPVWLGEIIIYPDSETEGNGVDFTVIIPGELKNYKVEITSLVNFYKLASKKFKILIDENI